MGTPSQETTSIIALPDKVDRFATPPPAGKKVEEKGISPYPTAAGPVHTGMATGIAARSATAKQRVTSKDKPGAAIERLASVMESLLSEGRKAPLKSVMNFFSGKEDKKDEIKIHTNDGIFRDRRYPDSEKSLILKIQDPRNEQALIKTLFISGFEFELHQTKDFYNVRETRIIIKETPNNSMKFRKLENPIELEHIQTVFNRGKEEGKNKKNRAARQSELNSCFNCAIQSQDRNKKYTVTLELDDLKIDCFVEYRKAEFYEGEPLNSPTSILLIKQKKITETPTEPSNDTIKTPNHLKNKKLSI